MAENYNRLINKLTFEFEEPVDTGIFYGVDTSNVIATNRGLGSNYKYTAVEDCFVWYRPLSGGYASVYIDNVEVGYVSSFEDRVDYLIPLKKGQKTYVDTTSSYVNSKVFGVKS